jgi:hypothetical protein
MAKKSGLGIGMDGTVLPHRAKSFTTKNPRHFLSFYLFAIKLSQFPSNFPLKVSYHVTIYHRNPPIRCEEQGCQFTTREARYIHFHKYYRHQIALPESIDLGLFFTHFEIIIIPRIIFVASRKCPLMGCKHVSKSPAMLDKHVQRHVADCLKEGGIYVCQMSGGGDDGNEFGQQQCQFTANGHEAIFGARNLKIGGK